MSNVHDTINYRVILNHAADFCRCADQSKWPTMLPNKAIKFPSGILFPDGRFSGASRLRDMLKAVEAGTPVATK